MSFSEEWESRYLKIGKMSQWPWSDLIAHCMRNFRGETAGLKVLELGCASGANIPFLLSLGMDYHGIDGSPSMVADLLGRFPQLEGKVAVGDFTREIPFAGPFDLVVDRSSLTHNHAEAIRACLRMVSARMKPGAKYIGIDWFSTAHSDMRYGQIAEDPFTRKEISSGLFREVGRVHFSDQAHLEDLFRDFRLDSLEHKAIEKKFPPPGAVLASWNLVATKRSDANG